MTSKSQTPKTPAEERKRGRVKRDGVTQRTIGRRTYHVARVVVTDPSTGQRHELTQRCLSLREAQDARKRLVDEAEKFRTGLRSFDAPVTFRELAKRFEAEVLSLEPAYHPETGAKVSMRAYAQGLGQTLRAHLRKFVAFFGDAELRRITPAALETFRDSRIAEPVTFRYTVGPLRGEPVRLLPKRLSPEALAKLTPEARQREKAKAVSPAKLAKLSPEERARFPKRTRPRTLATVNRELQFLRRVLSFAVECGSIDINPFGRRSKLIGAEPHRTRTLSLAEEEALILAASQEERAHLRPLLVMLLETGARLGEALALEWSNVKLDAKLIEIAAPTTKTRQARVVPITPRLATELNRIRPTRPHGRVFGDLSTVRRSFLTACRLAGIKGLRIHDLRHTAGSRLASRLPLVEVANVLGHRSLETVRRYSNPTAERLARAAEALDSFRTEEAEKPAQQGTTDAGNESSVN